MRSDLTAAALIRDAALELFAERGYASTTVRDIAGTAGVSPALVLHHYGSKDGLREAVDEHVSRLLVDTLEASLPTAESAAPRSLAESLGTHSPLIAYLRRRLLDSGDVPDGLFHQLFESTRAALVRLDGTGLLRPTDDPDVRAAFLLANDLAPLLLRNRIAGALGFDPLSEAGLVRWEGVLMDVYTNGVFAAPGGERP